MPKTLSQDDPNLLKAVQRLKRANRIWGGLLIGFGVLTQLSLISERFTLAGLALIALGVACWLFNEPALLGAAGVLIVLSIPPYLSPKLTLLGPDPLPQFISPADDVPELRVFTAAFTLGKLILAYMAFDQFGLMRFLYGSAHARVDNAQQPLVPQMVPNRVNLVLRWSLWAMLGSLAAFVLTLILTIADRSGVAPHLGAELTGSLGALALALGAGVAFSPTDFRGVAVLTMGGGALAYTAAVIILLVLP